MISVVNFCEKYSIDKHIIVHNFDAHIKNKNEGISSRYAINEYLLISDTIKELTNILNSRPSQTIQKKDKIYFSKDSKYPSLLLSRLINQYNVDLSRTITESKATKFIFNYNPIERYINSYRWSTLDDIHLSGHIGNTRVLCSIPNSTDNARLSFMKSSLEKLYNCSFYYTVPIRNHETVELYINHVNEAVDTRELTKYVNTFIPESTDSEIDTVFSFLKSTDSSIRNTGISLFSTLNVGSKLYNVIKKACELRCNSSWATPVSMSACNSSWNYFLQTIDCNLDELSYDFNTHQSYFLRKILQNPIYTGDMESIKKEIKQQLLKRLAKGSEFKTLREDLKLINCEIIIHDKNGETTPGD